MLSFLILHIAFLSASTAQTLSSYDSGDWENTANHYYNGLIPVDDDVFSNLTPDSMSLDSEPDEIDESRQNLIAIDAEYSCFLENSLSIVKVRALGEGWRCKQGRERYVCKERIT